MTVVYFILWLALNGRITMETVVLGAAAAILLDQFMRRVLDIRVNVRVLTVLRLLPEALLYAVVLVVEIFKANVAIIRLVLAPHIDVEPCLVHMRTKLRSKAARVVLANSITLTPGTITVSLRDDELLVHALNRDIAGGLENSTFERILQRMEDRALAGNVPRVLEAAHA